MIVESILQKKSKNSFTFSDRTMDELDFLCGSDRENQKDFIAELIRTEAEILDNYRRSDVCQHERLTLQPYCIKKQSPYLPLTLQVLGKQVELFQDTDWLKTI